MLYPMDDKRMRPAKTLLEYGTYMLVETVSNPAPDRRVKADWRACPTWEAGRIFIMTPWGIRSQNSYAHQMIESYEDRFELLASKLKPVIETPSMLLRRLDWSNLAESILDKLAADGRITIDQVQAALDAVLAEPDPVHDPE